MVPAATAAGTTVVMAMVAPAVRRPIPARAAAPVLVPALRLAHMLVVTAVLEAGVVTAAVVVTPMLPMLVAAPVLGMTAVMA